jgi:hypothetical protein
MEAERGDPSYVRGDRSFSGRQVDFDNAALNKRITVRACCADWEFAGWEKQVAADGVQTPHALAQFHRGTSVSI